MKTENRGFIKIAILIVLALVLLKYVYDIDILDRVYQFAIHMWEKYGDHLMQVWYWIKAQLS